MKFVYSILFILFMLTFEQGSMAQPDRLVRQGNKLYNEKDFEAAAEKYTKALDEEPNHIKGLFNLGDAFYENENFEEAIQKFEEAAIIADQDLVKAHAYHNAGNAYLKAKQLEKSIEAYKKSLRINPADDDTRYNLAYAQSLRQQQNQDQDKNQEKDKNKQEKQDEKQENDQQQEGDNEKEEQQQKQEQQPNEEKADNQEEGQQTQPQEGELSKEQAERILKALENDEKEVQEKMNKKRLKPVRIKIEKDW